MPRPWWIPAVLFILLLVPAWAQERYTEAELETLVQPVALYPDTLLTHVLTASTEPDQIQQAYSLSQSGGTPPTDWSPSVQALMGFPDVLAMLASNREWVNALGFAMANQSKDVLAAVQQVRARTRAAGNLPSSDQMNVTQQGDVIVIESPDPQVVYVPSYEPSLMYTAGVALITYGVAIAVRDAYWRGALDWHRGPYYGPPGIYRNWRYGTVPPGVVWSPRPARYAGWPVTRPVYNRTTVSNVRINNYDVRAPRTNVRVNNAAATRPPVTRPQYNTSGLQYTRGVDARAASTRGRTSLGSPRAGGLRGGRR